MQVSVDHDSHVLGARANLPKAVLEQCATIGTIVLDSVHRLEFLIFLVAGSGIDEHESGSVLDQQAAHPELNAVSLVCWNPALPQDLGHYAEHRAAIELLTPGLYGVDRQIADHPLLDERHRCTHAVVSLSTGRGIADLRRLARRIRARKPIMKSRSLQVRQPRSAASESSRNRQRAVASASPPAR